MTAEVVPIARRRRRCAVCGGRSVRINRFAMRTDADGRDVFVHLDCAPTWSQWQLPTCVVCGSEDLPGDPIGIYLDRRGGDVALHQSCWSAWMYRGSAIDTDTGCLLCGGDPDAGATWKVFTGSIEPDGFIHAHCRDSYVALIREELEVPCSAVTENLQKVSRGK
jgi:hypothetical protein